MLVGKKTLSLPVSFVARILYLGIASSAGIVFALGFYPEGMNLDKRYYMEDFISDRDTQA
jgi:hypothetical protein